MTFLGLQHKAAGVNILIENVYDCNGVLFVDRGVMESNLI